jgi:hypothetical protein
MFDSIAIKAILFSDVFQLCSMKINQIHCGFQGFPAFFNSNQPEPMRCVPRYSKFVIVFETLDWEDWILQHSQKVEQLENQ